MNTYDFLIVGAGIFGVTTAIELRRKGYTTGLLNPDTIPHSQAASTDISKVVRMEYGSSLDYMKMADRCIDGWKEWNDLFNTRLYHETGFLLLCKNNMEAAHQPFEYGSYHNLIKCGHRPQRLDEKSITKHYPVFRPGAYVDGFFHARAGFAEAGRAIAVLTDYARQLGVAVHEHQTADRFQHSGGKITGAVTMEGSRFQAEHTIVCAGASTPYLIPELQKVMRVTGHPVFHLQPPATDAFNLSNLPVFAADISNTGWYGFPVHPTEGVIKIANHGKGLELHPEKDERVVLPEDHQKLHRFLTDTFPLLSEQPVLFTRRCVYTDTLDGHFWIDRHPEMDGLTVGTGGSGHGYKMGPLLGKLIAAAALGEEHEWLEWFRWREISKEAKSVEEARNK